MTQKKYVIGAKPTRGKLIGMMLFSGLLSSLFTSLFSSILHLDAFFWLIFILLFCMTSLIYVPTFCGAYSFWSVDEEFLQYSCIQHYGEELKSSIAILFGKEIKTTWKIRIDQIEHMQLYYTSMRFLWNTTAYPVKLGIQLKDGTLLSFEALSTNVEIFVQALHFLSAFHHINIQDHDHLLEALSNPNIDFYAYLNAKHALDKGE